MPTTLPLPLAPSTLVDDGPIVVGVDARRGSDAAVAWAVAFGAATGRPVRAVMVASAPSVFPSGIDGFGLVMPDPDLFEASVALEHALDRAVPDPAAREAVQRRVLVGSIAECLVREAEQASLLVLGQGGPSLRRRLLSTAKAVMGRAPCPVVVVPSGSPVPAMAGSGSPSGRRANGAATAGGDGPYLVPAMW